MGFFKEIFIKETKTGKLVNITDLDKKHYESFLECTTKIREAYVSALERRGDVSSRLSNSNTPLVRNSVCGAHEHYQCRFRTKDNRCKCKDECDVKIS